MLRFDQKIFRICLFFCLVFLCNSAEARLRRYFSVPFGTVYSFARDTKNIYAGTDSGVFKSADGGLTWITFKNALSKSSVTVLAGGGDQLYAATDSGVFLSSDSAGHWKPAGNGLPAGNVYALTLSPKAVFAATATGLFKSLDKGLTWIQSNTGLTDLNVRHLLSFNTSLVAGTPSGTYISGDDGASWQLKNKGFKSSNIIALEAYGAVLYASTADGLYTSRDTGRTWLSRAFPKTEIVSFGTSRTKIFAGTLLGLYQSSDSGNTWLKLDSASKSTLYAITAEAENIVVAPNIGLRYSADGGLFWQSTTKGLRENPDPILEFIVYPNPSKAVFNVHFKDPNKAVSYSVSDLNGREMAVSKQVLDGELILDFNNSTKGIYFLFVQTETEIFTRKILLY